MENNKVFMLENGGKTSFFIATDNFCQHMTNT